MITYRRYLASRIDKIMAIISDRFGIDPIEVIAKYTSLTLRLKDLANSEYALS
jgi:Fe2+ transport system protein FeoA